MPEPIRLSPSQESDSLRVWYEIAQEDHFWFEWRLRAFLRQLDDLAVPRREAMHGLEIGCGHGLLRRQLEQHTGWIVDGCDLDERSLAEARGSRGATYLYNIHQRDEQFRERFDFLILFDVLEHIENPPAFLSSALVHLRPGGWLFVNVPALQGLYSRYDESVGHLRRYAPQSLRDLLAPPGLETRDLRYWGMSLLPFLGARRYLMSRSLDLSKVREAGFRPPNAWAHAFFRALARVEPRLIRSPRLGTSLLAAAVKTIG